MRATGQAGFNAATDRPRSAEGLDLQLRFGRTGLRPPEAWGVQTKDQTLLLKDRSDGLLQVLCLLQIQRKGTGIHEADMVPA